MAFQTDTGRQIAASKFMSLVLRHRPKMLGIELEEGGWAPVSVLLEGMNRRGFSIDLDDLEYLVEHNDKSRFAFDETGERIRANQGHSVSVDLMLEPVTPPDVLHHGTHEGAVAAILREGLKKMKRHHVHLSAVTETATKVGARRGKPIIFAVDAKAMNAVGHLFYRAENGVWLTDAVSPEFLKL